MTTADVRSTTEKCKAFEEQVEEYVRKVRARLDKSEMLTEGEKGIVANFTRLGWIDGWTACAERGGKTDVAYLIQDAVSHFANVCPWCDRDLDLYVQLEEIKTWLEEKK